MSRRTQQIGPILLAAYLAVATVTIVRIPCLTASGSSSHASATVSKSVGIAADVVLALCSRCASIVFLARPERAGAMTASVLSLPDAPSLTPRGCPGCVVL